jgi:PAS domain S-box-containing protein
MRSTHSAARAIGGPAHRTSGDVRTSEERYRSVVDNSPYGIYRVAFNGEFITVNPALCAMLGYAREDLMATNIAALYTDPLERPRILARYDQRPVGAPIDVLWRRRGGQQVAIRSWVYAERDPDGRVEFFDGYVEDVTAFRATEQALRQSEKLAAIGQLVSGVAHELNNPLSAILLFAEDLLTADRRPADEVDALTIIVQQARRSRAIVGDLLAFVRRGDLQRVRVDTGPFVAAAARALQPQVAALGAALHLDVREPESVIHVDRAGVEQVISNLITNAAQSAGAGGTVRFTARPEGRDYLLEVEDDGPGIPAEVLPRIFEPFFTTKPMGHGTGLGLSVSLGVVQQHGGTLTAENVGAPGPRGGARFVARLPLPTEVVAERGGRPTLLAAHDDEA